MSSHKLEREGYSSSQRISRRTVLKGFAGLGVEKVLISPFTRFSESVRAAESVGKLDLTLPVAESERDPRIKDLPKTKVFLGRDLKDNRDRIIRLDDVVLNTKDYTETVAQNRLDIATANHLARIDALWNYINGDLDKLEHMLIRGEMPPEPNAEEFIAKLQTDEDFYLPIVAVREGKEVALENLELTNFLVRSKKDGEGKIKGGVRIRYTSQPPLIVQTGTQEQPVTGWTIRVTEDNELQYDIYTANVLVKGYPQYYYSMGRTGQIVSAFESAILTLGNASRGTKFSDPELRTWWTRYALHNYEGRRSENGLAVFPDEAELLAGEIKIDNKGHARPFGPPVLLFESPDLVDTPWGFN